MTVAFHLLSHVLEQCPYVSSMPFTSLTNWQCLFFHSVILRDQEDWMWHLLHQLWVWCMSFPLLHPGRDWDNSAGGDHDWWRVKRESASVPSVSPPAMLCSLKCSLRVSAQMISSDSAPKCRKQVRQSWGWLDVLLAVNSLVRSGNCLDSWCVSPLVKKCLADGSIKSCL